MTIDAALQDLLEEQLAPLGPVTIRRMFGGGGVFLDGLMFGLVIDGMLYLKVDASNRNAYEAEGLRPFSYAKADGSTTVMSYWEAPERLYDEAEELLSWAREALAVARRAKAAAGAKTRGKPGPKTKPKSKPGPRRG